MAGAAPWYVADGWDTVTNYTYVSADEVQISFTNCNMVYTINFNTGVSRDVPTC
jgi:hypothetical protein